MQVVSNEAAEVCEPVAMVDVVAGESLRTTGWLEDKGHVKSV
jgi:hypothetical protein